MTPLLLSLLFLLPLGNFQFLFLYFLVYIFPVRSQKYGSDEPLVIPVKGPQAQFPALITADNFPLFPFTDQFNTGIELNPANKIVGIFYFLGYIVPFFQSVAGDMIIPVPGWGNFDVDGNVYFGNINVDAKVGYQIRPTNKLNIKPETLALLNQNPAFREARSELSAEKQNKMGICREGKGSRSGKNSLWIRAD